MSKFEQLAADLQDDRLTVLEFRNEMARAIAAARDADLRELAIVLSRDLR